MSKKIRILLPFIIASLIIFTIVIINCIKKEDITTEVALNRINENCFDITLDLESKTAKVDGQDVKIADLFSISNKELDEKIENNEFEDFLRENLVGDITYNNDLVTINNPYSTNKIIVQTENEDAFKNQENITSVEKIAENIYIVDFNNSLETKKGYEDLKANNLVEKTMKDYKFDILSDTVYSQSVSTSNLAWGVSSTGLGHYSKLLNDQENGKQIKIAVLDSGIRASHTAFSIRQTADKLDTTYSYDYVNSDNDVSDDNGHGTQVAGVIAESTSDNVKIVPIKVMGSNGQGSVSTILRAIADVCEKVDIINLSLGINPGNFSSEDMEILEDFFEEVYNNGTVVVCASGNDNTVVYYPACSNYTLAAGAIDENKNKTSFSNYGDSVDFALPGYRLKLPDNKSNTAYITANGTSYSSPFLASAVALVKAENNYTKISDIVNVLKENTEDLGVEGKDEYYGYGSINFDLSKFNSPVISYIKAIDTNWGLQNTILIKAICGSKIKNYAITKNNNIPTEWKNIETQSSEIEFEAKTSDNGTNFVWLKDENNNITYKSVSVSYVDTLKPTITKFEVDSITDSSISMKISGKDEQSGLAKIKWHYKKSSDVQYTDIVEIVEGNNINKTHIFSDLNKNTEYNIYAELEDKVGNIETTEVKNITTKNRTINISVENKTNGKAKVTIDNRNYTEDFTIKTDAQKIKLTCNYACIVLISNDGGKTYTKINESKIDTNIYEFNFSNEKDIRLIVALKGDSNLNGEINAADSMKIYRSLLDKTNSAFSELSNIEKIISDIDENNVVNLEDANLINKSNLSTTSSNYKKIEW